MSVHSQAREKEKNVAASTQKLEERDGGYARVWDGAGGKVRMWEFGLRRVRRDLGTEERVGTFYRQERTNILSQLVKSMSSWILSSLQFFLRTEFFPRRQYDQIRGKLGSLFFCLSAMSVLRSWTSALPERTSAILESQLCVRHPSLPIAVV